MVSAMAWLPASAAVTLPGYISDNMIVQRNSVMTLEGHASPGSRVTVHAGWEENPLAAEAGRDGSFSIGLPTPEAGGPWSITIDDGSDSMTLENIVSGEVWLCSGQSNMEFPVQGWTTVMDYDREVATAYHPDIRLLQVSKTTALSPQQDVAVNNGGWQICSSASMADFSAIAYFFARELSEKLGIPVGVIDATWGGTPAEAWTSAEALKEKEVAGFETELADLRAAEYDASRLEEIYNGRIDRWMSQATSMASGFDKATLQDGAGWGEIEMPSYWETNVLPGFDGVVWLQKQISIPEELAGNPATLEFAAIDDKDITFVNGVEVGKAAGYNTPHSYSIPASALKPGENVITVRVSDFGGEGGIMPGDMGISVGGRRIPLAGEWRYLVGADFSTLPAKPVSPSGSSYPSVLYNAMVAPLASMPVKGVLWYQGCANVGRAEQYEPLFKALINDWRGLWGQEMPFYFVQLAGYLQPKAVQPDSQWAALRNAQAKALELDNTAMVSAIDLGNPDDIHPKNKQDVAHRLALVALGRDYGLQTVWKAPVCTSAVTDGDSMLLTFDAPVHPTSKAITGFIIAGKDGVFTTATPVAEGDRTLRVSAPGVRNPKAVRYDWADFPCGNLYGETGLPVAPFATDK